jgi:hypothetical protein
MLTSTRGGGPREGFAPMKTVDYLDAVKRAQGIASDYRLSKNLGVSVQAVSNWRRTGKTPETFTCYLIAQILGIDPARVVADIERERAERSGRTDDAGKWARWIERASATTIAVVLSVWAGLQPAGEAQAATLDQRASGSFVQRLTDVYIVARCLARWLAAFCTPVEPCSRSAVAA